MTPAPIWTIDVMSSAAADQLVPFWIVRAATCDQVSPPIVRILTIVTVEQVVHVSPF